MNAIERLKNSMVRVSALVNFYREHPETILDMTDSMTAVTIGDLKVLLDGLADRDISLKRPELKTQKEIERDIKVAKAIVDEREVWTRGYDKGYKAGRDGELKRIEVLINRYLQGKLG